MPLSPEDKEEILSLFKESIGDVKTAIDSQIESSQNSIMQEMTKQIGGVMARSKKAIADSAASVKSEIESGIESSFGGLLASESNDTDKEMIASKTVNPNAESDNKLTQLANQIKTQSTLLSDMQKKYEESEKARQASAQSAMRSQLEADFISKISDKVVDPRTFLKVLSDRGEITEVGGKLVVKTGNLTLEGTDEFVPAETQIDTFLSNGFGYFAKPRPGNGGGTQSPSGTSVANTPSYLKDDATADDIFAALKSGKESDVLNELNSIQKK